MRLDQIFWPLNQHTQYWTKTKGNLHTSEHTTDTAQYIHGSPLAYNHYIHRSAGHDRGPRLDDSNVALDASQPIVRGGGHHKRSTAPETFGYRRQAGQRHAVGCQNPCRGLLELTWSIDARGVVVLSRPNGISLQAGGILQQILNQLEDGI
jgi:hypothetical protein